MRERTFLFDHDSFQQQARPFVERADNGNYEPILEQARSIANHVPPQEWILEGLGTGLSELDAPPEARRRVGFAFLVLLSKFLRPNPLVRSIGSVGLVVSHFGWSERDTRLLSQGMATTFLIKPGLVSDPLERPPAGDERWHNPAYYWWWIRPANAYNTGWLTYEQVTRFHERLHTIQQEYLRLDVSSLDLPPSLVITQQDLAEDYHRTIKLFQIAIAEKVGLFHILA